MVALLYFDEMQNVNVNVLLISTHRLTRTTQNDYLSPGFALQFTYYVLSK